ncbi:MAG: PAS domain S-box protein [Chloroflexi bacterium]|nr:PAS domain S-box protein [Chloroflexota bacterium]
MKPAHWFQRLIRHGWLRLILLVLLIYLAITFLAQFLVLSIATPETFFQLELLYGFAMLLVTTALIVWVAARYTAQVQQTEARDRQIVEQATDGIFVCDLAGNLHDVNPAGCAMLGYTREELLRRKIMDVIDPADLAAAPLQLDRLSHGQTISAVRRLLPRTGRPIMAEINARQIEANRIMGSVRDVTARQEMEAALRASEAQLRALVNALTGRLGVLDAQGTYQQVAPTNPGALVAPSDQLLGKTLAQVLPPATAADCLKAVQRALQTRSTINFEYDLAIDHQPRWFAASVSPISEDRVVWVARDVTRLKTREREWAAAAGLADELRVAVSQAEVLPLIVQQIRPWLEIEAAALGIVDLFTEEVVLKAAH